MGGLSRFHQVSVLACIPPARRFADERDREFSLARQAAQCHVSDRNRTIDPRDIVFRHGTF
jgi:hypothetical protein